ncbi:AraC family transcriptional regulator [Aquimarina longa]|uniref:AraC family transcriptional regulator n=1 Tax=Aquimarina longa TaxID=1080221 RepID=UPI000A66A2E1|nr:AraC family transcriptional regulator [Aquimarina longa]
MRRILLGIIIIFFNTTLLLAQDKKEAVMISDSLAEINYKGLKARFYNVLEKNETLARIYANTYLQKAKNEKNFLKIAKGYNLLSTSYSKKEHYKEVLVYLDSAITVSKQIEHKRYPSLFFINKGQAYEEEGNFKQALDNYLEAIQWCKKSKNSHLEFITKHNIGLLKRKLRKYREAKDIFKECLSYRSSKEMTIKDSLSYLVTLSGLVHTYRLTNEVDSALFFNKEGIKSSKGKDILYLFELNEAILQYYDKSYKTVITDIDSLLPKLLKPENKYFFETTDLINAYLYQGKSHEALRNKDMAVEYYKKIDSLLQISNYIIPETRTTYTNLINYYKSLNDKNKQLFYINRLLRSDSILDSNYEYLSDRLIKDYDTPKLLLQKEKLIGDLEAKHSTSLIGVLILSIIVVIVVVFLMLSYKKQKRYQQRFEELIASKDKIKEEKKPEKGKTPGTSNSIGISEEIVNAILDNLSNFEKKQDFIKINITTSVLASKFGTNSKYLSKVINTYKQKSFIQYINDLRIEYIIEKLKSNTKYRMYTIKALAAEAGFNTTEAFSKSFYKKTGIYPSYFIKKLEKQDVT